MTEEMTHFVRTFWKDGLEEITDIGDRVVHTSQSEALNSAIAQVNALGIPDAFRVLRGYDIADCLDIVLIEWRTGGKSSLGWITIGKKDA